MNNKVLLIALSIAALSSCSTAYKTGQTPDDVYYSPARYYDENDDRKRDDRDEARRYDNEDREIRMSIRDPRWRRFDNDYGYHPYAFGYGYDYYYNPYYCSYPVYNTTHVSITSPVKTTPRITNLAPYQNNNYNYSNTGITPKTGGTRPSRSYNNNNNRGRGLDKVIRNVLGDDRSGSRESSSGSGTRNYSNSSSSGSSSSTPSAPVNRPTRSGN